MDMPVNQFKRAILAGTSVPYGVWLVSGAPATAEALGSAGFDFLVVDTEHTPIDPPQVADVLRTMAGTPASAVVRPAWNDMVLIKRLLDTGAQTLLIPFVQNAEEAKRAVAYTRYPPDGVRGVAAVHRGSRWGNVPNYQKAAAAEICVIVQIETAAAVEHLPAIAAVPGVDSLFIGPADLAASMGHLGDFNHPDVQAKIRHAVELCRKAGKPVGTVGPNPEMVIRYLEYGFTWIAINSDIGMMVGRATEWLGKVKAGAPGAARA
jgi:2-dehydro-3-deoxyglucarate aldolase/4-hydroxy-2-oxoheptanedioate aldolase